LLWEINNPYSRNIDAKLFHAQKKMVFGIRADVMGSGLATKRSLEGNEGEQPSAKRQRPDHKAAGLAAILSQ
jgi:hypothetical protein